MLYIHPRDIRIIRNLGYTKPLCILLENQTSFYNVILNRNNSCTYYERKYKSYHTGRTSSISELAMGKKIISHYEEALGAMPVVPPLYWKGSEKHLSTSLDENPSENNIEYLYENYGWCPFFNRKTFGIKDDGTYSRILKSPLYSGFYSDEQSVLIGGYLVYKVAGVEHRITEITYDDKSNFKDAHRVVLDEEHLFKFSHKEKFYGTTNPSVSCSFGSIKE